MRIIYNRLIPFPDYSAMMLFGVIFARRDAYPLSKYTINHESIHREQAGDFLHLLWRCAEWLSRHGWALAVVARIIRIPSYLAYYGCYGFQCARYGYRNSPFEREAYDNSLNLHYLDTRKRKAWKRYK